MRCGPVVLASVLMLPPVSAAPRPPAYDPAEDVFDAPYTLRERVIAQVLLIAAGHQNAVPTERFTLNTFNAARDFQIAAGLAPSGALDQGPTTACSPGATTGQRLDPADLADAAKAVSGFVACQ